MTSTATLNRDQNTYTVNAHLSDEVLFVNPAIASDVEEVQMNIAEGGMDFIFDMLSDLSANRGAYAIREAYSNAYDATVVAGDMTRPIEITLYADNGEDCLARNVAEKSGMLGAFSMFASITDHGCGMTTDDVKKYFTQYGGSNKRDGKFTIGSKGLGSKAPLACADLFTVESTKDGVTTTATIERKQGRNCATVRAEETGKDSGTTITIPLTDMKIYEQMRECVENIIQWNLDATIIYNGEITEPNFTENALGSFITRGNKFYGADTIDYIYLGNVPVAVDEDGNTVSFRMWQKAKAFPTMDAGNIDLNLAGVRYPLRNWRYENPTLIVAGEPGFLNFTPSRDEIKDDDAKSNFIYAIEKALADYDFTDTVSSVLSNKNIYEMRDWLFSRCYNTGFSATDNGKVRVDMAANNISYEVPADVFVKDGIDYSGLFLGTGDMACAKVMVADVDSWNDRVLFKVASTRHSYHIEDRAPELFVAPKKETANCGSESFAADVLFRSVMRNSDNYEKTFVITGAGADGQKRFINNEKTIRDAYGSADKVLYILCDEGCELTDMDKAAFGDENVEYVTLDEMLEAAREFRKANRAAAAKNDEFSKKLAERYGRIRCFNLKNAGYSFENTNYYHIGTSGSENFDYESVDSFETLAEKNIIMLIDMKDCRCYNEIGTAAVILGAMSDNGTLDSTIENLLVMPKMNVNDIKAFINAGGKFFSDVRKKPSAHITETILDATCGLKAVTRESWSGNRDFSYFEVDPVLVMSEEAAAELEGADTAYWHAAENTRTAADVMALVSLLPDGYENYKAMMPTLGKVIAERSRGYGRVENVVFKAAATDESIAFCEKFDKVCSLIREAFSEISVDNFYNTVYNEEKAERVISFRKNAELMLAPMVSEMAAKMLG